jgi:hypothetical protein
MTYSRSAEVIVCPVALIFLRGQIAFWHVFSEVGGQMQPICGIAGIGITGTLNGLIMPNPHRGHPPVPYWHPGIEQFISHHLGQRA